ncbi:MAG: AbrB/MazE/SpoVT family DNA-binding domain-containing protein, partial [Candidatus Korarchaeota archaeon]|nr:AbrB/MazE/SpoVT family DNA-binding domain-containing protein [Candidatus Korarchaeota archaeon]
MEARIDTEGKIIIPQAIREKLGITEGTRFVNYSSLVHYAHEGGASC